MSTRSYIGVECADGIYGVYCHWDGYLEHNGHILKTHYKEFMKVCALINGGNISSLGTEIGEKHDFNDFKRPADTTYYGRDRGEKGIEFQKFINENQFVKSGINCWAEFIYLFKNGKWYYTTPNMSTFREV